MVRFKIQSKKPKDIILEKSPKEENLTTIKQKTPNGFKKQFKLPPSREIDKRVLKKEPDPYPTNYGIKEEKKSQIASINNPPPAIRAQDKGESTTPSSKGSLPKLKRKKNQKIPRQREQRHYHEDTPPSRKGITEKKPGRIINKLPPPAVIAKYPKMKITPPPSTGGFKEKNEKMIKSKTPPKSNIDKVPKNSKSVPPTIIKTKIPKTKINSKKPE